MTSIGTIVTPTDPLQHLRSPSLLIRGLISVLVIVPAIGFATAFAFDLSLPEQVGVVLMAIAPGAPLALRRALASGGHAGFAPALPQIALAILAVPAATLWVAIGNCSFYLAKLPGTIPTAKVWEGGRLVAGSNDESGRVYNSQDVTPRETNSPRSARSLIGTSYFAEREGNRAMTQQRLNLQGMPPEPETDSRRPAGSANHEVSATITLPPGI